jgi:hypothetical protein
MIWVIIVSVVLLATTMISAYGRIPETPEFDLLATLLIVTGVVLCALSGLLVLGALGSK